MNESARDAVLAYTNAHPGANGASPTALSQLTLFRSDRETPLEYAMYEPALIIVVQGSKELLLGDARIQYRAGQYLVSSVGIPVRAAIIEASDARPYLALVLTIDRGAITDLLAELGDDPSVSAEDPRFGIFIGTLQARQADAVTRLADLLAAPDALRVLYPAITRELFYWLLVGPDGAALRRLAAPNTHVERIADAIATMRSRLIEGVPIDRLAEIAHMSPSSFHQHFKAITSLSPRQYQKQLRLLEARRLLLSGRTDAARAAYEVGYESASQFSREYARMFGSPPRRDIAAVRSAAS